MPYKDDNDKRVYNRERRREETAKKQDIGPPPPRKNLRRYEKACESFRYFCEAYFRDKDDPECPFSLKWSPDHLEVIGLVEKAVNVSLQLALAMPRGSGKTTLFMIAIIWAILTGRRNFGVLIAATNPKSLDLIRRIKTILLNNEKLAEDFGPELHGILALDGESRRCAGQNIGGQKTGIEWRADRIVFPRCPGSKASCAVITAVSLGGPIEGLVHITIDGQSRRPDIVLGDDPQTRKSAKSVVQTATRLEILNAAVAGLGGPKKGVSILLAGTKMRPGDLMDQLLDTKRFPEWGGRIYPAVKCFPSTKARMLWDQYRNVYLSDGSAAALVFYKKHRKKMDDEMVVYWPERFHPEKDEISGNQHLMNLFYKDSVVFWSEYQNAPQSEGTLIYHLAERSHVESLCIGTHEGIAQDSSFCVVAHIDIHELILYYSVSAISSDFTIRKIAHGTYPRQDQLYFTEANCPNPLRGDDQDAAIFNGLVCLANYLYQKRWTTDSGKIRRTRLITIDQQWNRDLVHRVAVEFPVPRIVYPYYGIGVTPRNKPIAEYRKRQAFDGHDSVIRTMCYENVDFTSKGDAAMIGADVNMLKTFLHDRLKLPKGLSGGITFAGGDGRFSSVDHNRFFFDHLYGETPVLFKDNISGRKKTMWDDSEGHQNHWLDCFCANIAAGEMMGASLGFRMPAEKDAPGGAVQGRPKPKRHRGVRQAKR